MPWRRGLGRGEGVLVSFRRAPGVRPAEAGARSPRWAGAEWGAAGGRPWFWRAGERWREGGGKRVLSRARRNGELGGGVSYFGAGPGVLGAGGGSFSWRQGWGLRGGLYVPTAACSVPVPRSFTAAWLWLQLKLCLRDHRKPSRSTNRHSKSFRVLFLTVGEDLALAPLCLSFPRSSRE